MTMNYLSISPEYCNQPVRQASQDTEVSCKDRIYLIFFKKSAEIKLIPSMRTTRLIYRFLIKLMEY